MRITMRTASVFIPISSLLVATSALCAAPPGNTAVSPSVAAGSAEPATTPSESPATPAAAPSAPPELPATAPTSVPASTSGTSVAASPYGPPKPAASTAQPPKPAPPHKDEGPPTLLGGDYAIGGFGGIGVMYTRFVGRDAVQVCGEGAVIIDHSLTLGGGGCGIATEINAEHYGPTPHYANDKMNFGYGGAIVKYHLFSNKPINLGVGALIGAGGITIGTRNDSSSDWSDNYTHQRSWAVFVMEPQVGGYANLTRWLRVGVTAGYRIVAGVKTEGLSASDFCSPTLGGVIQGGWF